MEHSRAMPKTLYQVGDFQAPPPHLFPGLPLLGNAIDFIKNPLDLFLRSYRKFGPISRIKIANRAYVVMMGPEAMQFLAKEERELFTIEPIYADFNKLLLAKRSMISVDKEEHVDLRKRFKPPMSRGAMERNLPKAVEIVSERLKTYRPGQTVDVTRFMREIVFCQLGEIMAGEQVEEYYDDIIRVMHYALEIGVIKRLPKVMAYNPRFLRSRRRLIELTESLVEKHKDDEGEKSNVFHVLRRALNDGVLETCDSIMVALTPYFAGLDTVANSMAFMFYAIFNDPHLRRTLEDETKAAFDGGPPSGAWLRRLPTVNATKSETLRRYPITIASIRQCLKDFTFAGHQVKAGENVMFAISAQSFMSEHFSNPEKFDISRFDKDHCASRDHGTYTPFGVGAHSCLGAGLAEIQMVATMAALLNSGKLEMVAKPGPLKIAYKPVATPVGVQVKIN